MQEKVGSHHGLSSVIVRLVISSLVSYTSSENFGKRREHCDHPTRDTAELDSQAIADRVHQLGGYQR